MDSVTLILRNYLLYLGKILKVINLTLGRKDFLLNDFVYLVSCTIIKRAVK